MSNYRQKSHFSKEDDLKSESTFFIYKKYEKVK